MYKWLIVAASCLTFSVATAQETVDSDISSTEEITVDEGTGGDTTPSTLMPHGCPCGKGKSK